jgi:predicted ester cyclase
VLACLGGGDMPGDWPPSMLAWNERVREAFADVEHEVHDVVVADDGRVAVRVRFRGLHVAPYAGIEPCGRTIEFDEVHLWRMQDGRPVEHWGLRDEIGALRQMGAPA